LSFSQKIGVINQQRKYTYITTLIFLHSAYEDVAGCLERTTRNEGKGTRELINKCAAQKENVQVHLYPEEYRTVRQHYHSK